MKKKVIILIFLVGLILSYISIDALAISDFNPADYNSEYYLKNKVIDENRDEGKFWPEFDNENSKAVALEKYKYELTANEQPQYVKSNIKIDYSKDYEIEFSLDIKTIENDKNGAYFLFGYEDDSNYYFLGMKRGRLQIGFVAHGEKTYFVNESIHELYDDSETNERYFWGGSNYCKIRKFESKLYFFYGEELIFTSNNFPHSGYLGLYAGKNNRITLSTHEIEIYFDDFLNKNDSRGYGIYPTDYRGVELEEFPIYDKDQKTRTPMNELYRKEYKVNWDAMISGRNAENKPEIYTINKTGNFRGLTSRNISKDFDLTETYIIDIFFELIPEDNESLDLGISLTYDHQATETSSSYLIPTTKDHGFKIILQDKGYFSLGSIEESVFRFTQFPTTAGTYKREGENRLSIINHCFENTSQIDLNGRKIAMLKKVRGESDWYPGNLNFEAKGKGTIIINSILVRGFKK